MGRFLKEIGARLNYLIDLFNAPPFVGIECKQTFKFLQSPYLLTHSAPSTILKAHEEENRPKASGFSVDGSLHLLTLRLAQGNFVRVQTLRRGEKFH